MNQLDDMLAGLSAEGSLEARREFQIDSAKAREKLQKFQLEDPHFYVLELVQAAHLLGATEIRFTIDADEMEVFFDGDALTRLELEELYSAAFAKLTDRRKQAMRHLAIGFNAAQALLPSKIELQVAEDVNSGSLLLVSRPGQERDEITEVEGPAGFVGTRVYLRESFRTGHLVEFFHNLKGSLAEKTALRERCLYSHIPVFLDGEQISTGHQLPEDVLGAHPFRTEQERGMLGIYPNRSASTLSILQNGVLVTTVHAPSGIVNTVAVVDSRRLNKNLSQSAFVEDKQWSYLLGQVLRLEMYEALARYFEEVYISDSRGVFKAAPVDWVVDIIHTIAAEIPLYRERSIPLPAQTVRLIELLERWQCIQLSHKLEDDSIASEENKISIGQLRELLGDRRTITFSVLSFDKLEAEALSPVILGNDSTIDWLRQWLGFPLKDVSVQLNTMNHRRINYERWQSQPLRSGALLATRYRIRVPFDCGDGVEGVWAIDPNEWSNAYTTSHSGCRITFIKDGRVFSRREFDAPFFKGSNLVFKGDIEANDLFDGPREDAAMFARYLIALEHFAILLDKLAGYLNEVGFNDYGYGYFLSLISAQLSKDLARQLLDDMGVPAREFPQELAQWKMRQQRQKTLWGLKQEVLVDRAGRIEALGAMADIPFYEDFAGDRCSLREIASEIDAHGKIGVYDGTITPTLREDWDRAELDQRVYLIGRGLESSVLSQVVSARYYRYMGQVIRRHALANRYLDRDEVPVALPSRVPFVLEGDYAYGQNRGVFGLVPAITAPGLHVGVSEPKARPLIKVRVLYKQRLLQELELEVAMGQFHVVLDAMGINPNASWDAVLEDSNWLLLVKNLREHAAATLRARISDLSSRLTELDSYEYFELWVYLWQAHVARFPGGREYFSDMRRMLTELAVFVLHDGSRIYYPELSSLVHKRRELYVVKKGEEVLDALLPTGHEVKILVVPDLPEKHLEYWLGEFIDNKHLRVIDVTDTSEAKQALEHARASYMKRSELALELPAKPDEVIFDVEIEGSKNIRGRIGMLFDPRPMDSYPGVAIEVLVHRRRATTTSQELFLGRFTSRIESDDVILAGDYENVIQDEDYRQVLRDVSVMTQNALIAHLERHIEEGWIASPKERELFESYLVRVSQIRTPLSLGAQQIVTLLRELPLFELLDTSRGRRLATGPADKPPFTSLDELSSVTGEAFIWVDSKMGRERIPDELDNPVVVVRDMTHRRKLGPVLDRLHIPDLANHIRRVEEDRRKAEERERRRLEHQAERERAKERERLERERLAREAERRAQNSAAKEALAEQRRVREQLRRSQLEEDERALQGDGEDKSVIVSDDMPSVVVDKAKERELRANLVSGEGVTGASGGRRDTGELFTVRQRGPATPNPALFSGEGSTQNPEQVPAPAPEPELEPAPEPEPEPAPPDPAELLLEDVIAQLKRVRGNRSDLVGDPILSRLSVIDRLPGDVVADVSKSDVKVSRAHMAMCYALEVSDDPVALAFLSSSVYSAINLYYEKITDADELVFQERMLSALLESSH